MDNYKIIVDDNEFVLEYTEMVDLLCAFRDFSRMVTASNGRIHVGECFSNTSKKVAAMLEALPPSDY